jgi:hypothetical protein
MLTRTRIALGALATIAVAGGTAGAAAAQASGPAPGRLTFVSQLTAIRFFTSSGPIAGFPTKPLVPGDRIIGQDRILQHGKPAGHDNEVCTVSFRRDVLCQDISPTAQAAALRRVRGSGPTPRPPPDLAQLTTAS